MSVARPPQRARCTDVRHPQHEIRARLATCDPRARNFLPKRAQSRWLTVTRAPSATSLRRASTRSSFSNTSRPQCAKRESAPQISTCWRWAVVPGVYRRQNRHLHRARYRASAGAAGGAGIEPGGVGRRRCQAHCSHPHRRRPGRTARGNLFRRLPRRHRRRRDRASGSKRCWWRPARSHCRRARRGSVSAPPGASTRIPCPRRSRRT